MAEQANHPLPAGFQFADYTLETQVSAGGFSIVYRARDRRGDTVAIKEYLPHHLALRGPGETRPRISDDHQAAFRYGLKCFFEESRALVDLHHPNVVRALNFFRANDTVYLVMRFEAGHTLQQRLQQGIAPSERFLLATFDRLLGGLREVHAHRLLHLDIKPSNILLRPDDSPVLLDFGAARQVLASDQPLLKPTFTAGYASPEHTGEREQLGPWSDIYSVGATLYACLAGGQPPLAAAQRLSDDTLPPARQRWAGAYSEALLECIDWCLCLEAGYRPQSVFALQKALQKIAASATEPATANPPLPRPGLRRWLQRWRRSSP